MNKVFKVVKIINEYQIVVNAGSNDTFYEGDEMEIYEPGQEVTDPDTGESLGTLDYVKAKLYIIDIFPKMCICENRESEVETSITDLLSKSYSKKSRLNVETRDISGGFESVNKKIRVGDLVRKKS